MNKQTVLIFTCHEDATSDYLTARLLEANIVVVRYDTDSDLCRTRFNYSKTGPVISWNDYDLCPDDISAIVIRRPKPLTPKLEGDQFHIRHASEEWSEAIEGFLAHVPIKKWINHPSRNYSASHKVEQLSRAIDFGLNVPESIVTSEPSVATAFVLSHPDGVIIKPLASGYIERYTPKEDTVIYTQPLNELQLPIFDSLHECPVLFQNKIRKHIDVRLTVLDERMIAVGLWRPDSNGSQILDIRRDNMEGVEYLPIRIPNSIEEQVLSLMKYYELRFAAIDFAIDLDGSWIFFEINPNGQWAWLDIIGSSKIADLFIAALGS